MKKIKNKNSTPCLPPTNHKVSHYKAVLSLSALYLYVSDARIFMKRHHHKRTPAIHLNI